MSSSNSVLASTSRHPPSVHMSRPLARAMNFRKGSASRRAYLEAVQVLLDKASCAQPDHTSIAHLRELLDGHHCSHQHHAPFQELGGVAWISLPWYAGWQYANFNTIVNRYNKRVQLIAHTMCKRYYDMLSSRRGFSLGGLRLRTPTSRPDNAVAEGACY